MSINQLKPFAQPSRPPKRRSQLSPPITIESAWVIVTRIGGDWIPVADECESVRAWPVYECADEAEAVTTQFRIADPDGEYLAVAVSVQMLPRYA